MNNQTLIKNLRKMGVTENDVIIKSRIFSQQSSFTLRQLKVEYRTRSKKRNLTKELEPFIFVEPLKSISFSNKTHAIHRWNERVGPNIKRVDKLHQNIVKLYQLHRIKFLKPNIGLIDNDILFYFFLDSNYNLVITTFLGRISSNPLLDQYDTFSSQWINLKAERHQILRQFLPVLPNQQVIFLIGKRKYIFEEYKINGKRYLIVKDLNSNHRVFTFLSLDKLFRLTKHKTVKGKLQRCTTIQKHILRCYLKLMLIDQKQTNKNQIAL